MATLITPVETLASCREAVIENVDLMLDPEIDRRETRLTRNGDTNSGRMIGLPMNSGSFERAAFQKQLRFFRATLSAFADHALPALVQSGADSTLAENRPCADAWGYHEYYETDLLRADRSVLFRLCSSRLNRRRPVLARSSTGI